MLTQRYHEKRDDYSVIDLLFRNGSALDALMYQELFWPSFVEINDMIFWAELASEEEDLRRISAAYGGHNGDRTAVERLFNQIGVPYLFGNPDPTGEVNMEWYRKLGEALRDMWSARLKSLYPRRDYDVQLHPDEPTLVISQRR